MTLLLSDAHFQYNAFEHYKQIVDYFSTERDEYIIDLIHEGVSLTGTGLSELIEYAAQATNVPLRSITVINENLLKEKTKFNVKYQKSNYHSVIQAQEYAGIVKKENINKIFGLFVNKSNWQRLFISSWTYERKNAIQSFLTSPLTGWETEFGNIPAGLGYDDLCKQDIPNINFDIIHKFIKDIPLVLDGASSLYNSSVGSALKLKPYYSNFMVEIVMESMFRGEVFFPTEKIFRPVAFGCPFVVAGPVDFLKNLRRFGFETFSNFWSEYYDDIEDENTRLNCVLDTLSEITTWNEAQLMYQYNNMLPILEHNYHTLLDLTKKKYIETFE